MGKPHSLGICTPIPAVPVDPAKYKAGTDLSSHLALITPEWHRARMALATPPGHNAREVYADGMEVGVARCKAVEFARDVNLRYLLFIDWDVLVPPDAAVKLMYHLENNPEYGVAAGVYCMKSIPPHPLIWRDWGDGVAWDWTVGDLLMDRVVGVPMGCTLIRLDVFDKLPVTEKPWFKTLDEVVNDDKGEFVGKASSTEDFYFCKRYTEEAAGKIMVDCSILCEHIDHKTGVQYQLPTDCLPWRRQRERLTQQQ